MKALDCHMMPILLLSMANRNRDVLGRLFQRMQCENQYIIPRKGFDDARLIWRVAPVIDILGGGGYDPERIVSYKDSRVLHWIDI